MTRFPAVKMHLLAPHQEGRGSGHSGSSRALTAGPTPPPHFQFDIFRVTNQVYCLSTYARPYKSLVLLKVSLLVGQATGFWREPLQTLLEQLLLEKVIFKKA